MPALDDTAIELIIGTIRTLQEYLHTLEHERARLDHKMADVQTAIERWQGTLRGPAPTHAVGPTPPRLRRKKGENLQVVHDFFLAHAGETFTTQEIAQQTGLAHSSVQVVVSKKNGRWERGEEGRWRLRKSGERGYRSAS